jgi:hypothetical protein
MPQMRQGDADLVSHPGDRPDLDQRGVGPRLERRERRERLPPARVDHRHALAPLLEPEANLDRLGEAAVNAGRVALLDAPGPERGARPAPRLLLGGEREHARGPGVEAVDHARL